MDVWQGDYEELKNLRLAFGTYLPGFRHRLGGCFSPSIVVTPAWGMQLSKDSRSLLYSSQTWPGALGGALLTHGGQLVGIHTETVRPKKLKNLEPDDGHGRITQLEEFVKDVMNSTGSLCIARLAGAVQMS